MAEITFLCNFAVKAFMLTMLNVYTVCTLNSIQFRTSECLSSPKPFLHAIIVQLHHCQKHTFWTFKKGGKIRVTRRLLFLIAYHVLMPSKASSTAGISLIITHAALFAQEAGKSPAILGGFSRANRNFLRVTFRDGKRRQIKA